MDGKQGVHGLLQFRWQLNSASSYVRLARGRAPSVRFEKLTRRRAFLPSRVNVLNAAPGSREYFRQKRAASAVIYFDSEHEKRAFVSMAEQDGERVFSRWILTKLRHHLREGVAANVTPATALVDSSQIHDLAAHTENGREIL